MKTFSQYEHHDCVVWVINEVKGKHREHCLCHSCRFFHPNENEELRKKNCPIANRLYQLCVDFNLTTPVYECPHFLMIEEN